jgi:hypothetical protein
MRCEIKNKKLSEKLNEKKELANLKVLTDAI